MSSYELAQSLREHAQRRHVRLIALTFDPAHAAREEARAAGFERSLVKPFAPGDLSDLLCYARASAPRSSRRVARAMVN
jgi:CheY-like chemotaxis protein